MMAGRQPDLFSSSVPRRSALFDGDAFGDRQRDVAPARFDGPDFDPVLDGDRLKRQLDAVRGWMLNHEWQSLVEIADGCGFGLAAVASISARLRDLRKRKFGAYTVERRRRTAGTWEYRVLERAGGAAA